MTPHTIVVPYAHLRQDNHRLAPGRGRMILSQRYREGLWAMALVAKAAWGRKEPLDGPVMLEIRYFMPDRRKRDVANTLKGIHDAFTGIVYCDDEQIRHETWVKVGVDRANPRAEITVYQYEVPPL